MWQTIEMGLSTLLLLSLSVVAAAASSATATAAASEPENEGGQLRALAGRPATAFPPTVHRCVHSATKLAKQTTAGNPCMYCDPASDQCNSGCQLLIDGLYHVCAGICLPDGYYYDPQSLMPGCFKDNTDMIKMAVERCGCNSGFSSLAGASRLATALTVLLACALYLF